MLVILSLFILFTTILVVIFNRNKYSIYRLFLAISLAIEIIGYMIYIAKKGGYTKEVIIFLFINNNIKSYLQYLYITLDTLGYIISLGRYIYPLFLLLFAITNATNIHIWHNKKMKVAVWILPSLSLVLYYPAIYRMLIKANPAYQSLLAVFSVSWIIIYLVVSIGILIYEYVSIRLSFNKSIYRMNFLYIISMTGLYTFYCLNDPGQVYKFYGYGSVLAKSFGYLQYSLSINGYFILLGVNATFGLLNIYSLIRYTHKTYIDSRENYYIEREFNAIKIGTSVFVHSIKNQLLDNRVIYKRLNNLLNDKEIDYNNVIKYIKLLENKNSNLLTRIEELNNTVKFNKIYLKPVSVEEVIDSSMNLFRNKAEKTIIHSDNVLPTNDINTLIDIEYLQKPFIMASKVQLSEVFYNLLTNAYEAIEEKNIKNPKISIKIYTERKYTIVEVRDNGKGIDKVSIKKIFKPYFSSKNSKNNWGMGLYYTRQIVKSHFGKITVESKMGEYTMFYISLPTYLGKDVK